MEQAGAHPAHLPAARLTRQWLGVLGRRGAGVAVRGPGAYRLRRAGGGRFSRSRAAAFGLMRVSGLPVKYADVAWPPAWRRFDTVRSRHFFEQATAALAENQAVVSLKLAVDHDPENYEATFMLAQLWQAGRPEAANELYGRLLQSHPDRAAQTAHVWGRSHSALRMESAWSTTHRRTDASRHASRAIRRPWLGTNSTAARRPTPSDASSPTRGDFSTCTVMCRNGARTGTAVIPVGSE